MPDALTTVLTSAGVAAVVSGAGVLINGQLQRRQELRLKRSEEARQLRDAKRERLWLGLRVIAEVAMGIQEANVDLMRAPEHADQTQNRGEELYTLVEGHRADIVLVSLEGRDLLLDLVGAIRRYQALGVDWTTHQSLLAAQGSDHAEAPGRRQRIDGEHDAISKATWNVLDRARALLEAQELPAYPPSSPSRIWRWLSESVQPRLLHWWPWGQKHSA